MTTKRHTSSMLATGLLLGGLLAIFASQRILSEGSLPKLALSAGALLCLVAVGLRFRAWSSTKGDVRAVEGRLLGAYGGMALALALYGLGTESGLKVLSLAEPAAARAVTVLYVLWVSTLLVSLSAIFFMELVYLRMPVAESVELRRVRTSLHAGLSLALSMVFLACINYVASERDVRTDVSYFKTSRPSQGTQALIAKLDQPLRVILFFAPGSDALVQVKPYFDALAAASKKISVKVMDVALAPDLATKHKVTDNGEVLLLHGEGKDEKGEILSIGSGLTEARTNLRRLDGNFQQSFRKVVRPARTLLLTVGHREHNAKGAEQKPGDATGVLSEVLHRLNLTSDTIGVGQGLGRKVPDIAGAVAIVGPSDPFLPEEAETLLAYVRKGGKLFLMLDPNTDVGLSPLLKGLGVELLPGTLLSETHHMSHAHNASDLGIVFSNTYTAHPIVTTAMRNQREVGTVFVNGAGIAAVAAPVDPKPNVTFPLRSTHDFFRDVNSNFKQDPDEKTESVNLIAAVTIKGTGDTEGRAVIVGDGDFMTDKVAANNGNLLVFVDSLAWLIGNEDLSGEVNSEEDVPIEHSRQEDKIWFYATTFAMPAPIVFLGLWVTRRRRLRGEQRS